MADGNNKPTCNWIGASQKSYAYEIYSIGTKFRNVPGNYIFSKMSANRKWVAVYIGETEDLSSRFDTHHAMDCILRNGASHIHVHASSEKMQVRLNEETDIRQNYKPSCNKQ